MRADLPRDSELLIHLLRIKEAVDVLAERCLEILLQHDIVPVSLLSFLPQGRVLLPVSLIEHPYLVVERFVPDADFDEECPSG